MSRPWYWRRQIIGPAIETVAKLKNILASCSCQVPVYEFAAGAVLVSSVKSIITIVEVTAWITEANQVACAMRDVSIVRKTVTENDDLSKRRRLRVNENWSRQKNGDPHKFCYSHENARR